MQTDRIEHALAIDKSVDLRYVLGYSPLEFRDPLHAIADGRVACAPMITGTVGLGGVDAAFDVLGDAGHHAKVLIDPKSEVTVLGDRTSAIGHQVRRVERSCLSDKSLAIGAFADSARSMAVVVAAPIIARAAMNASSGLKDTRHVLGLPHQMPGHAIGRRHRPSYVVAKYPCCRAHRMTAPRLWTSSFS